MVKRGWWKKDPTFDPFQEEKMGWEYEMKKYELSDEDDYAPMGPYNHEWDNFNFKDRPRDEKWAGFL